MRFEKLVADALGVTRKEAKAVIKEGQCAVGGKVVTDPGANISETDELYIFGKRVSYEKYIYIMMNKPGGVISATEDKRQKTVLDLLPENYKRYDLFPVGRLDIDTEGILLITNDGKSAHSLLAPSKKVPKEYFVRLSLPLSDSDIKTVEQGVDIGGYVTAPACITPLSSHECTIKITEGKFHQVKRMFEAVGNKVVFLKRTSFAALTLDPGLPPGSFRRLSQAEVDIILSLK